MSTITVTNVKATTISDTAGTAAPAVTGAAFLTARLNYEHASNTIRSSLNAASVTDTAAGRFTFNATNAFDNGAPAFTSCSRRDTSRAGVINSDSTLSVTSTAAPFANASLNSTTYILEDAAINAVQTGEPLA